MSAESRFYGGRSVEHRRTERRTRFREAALATFATKSYAQTSVADICAVAGLSRRQFYEEYDSREAVLVAVYDEIQDAAFNAANSALTHETGSPHDRLALATAAYIEAVTADTRRAQVAFVEVVGVSEKVELLRRARRAQWVSTVETWVAASFPTVVTPPAGWPLAGAAFIAATNGLIHEWVTTGQNAPMNELTDLLTAILFAVTGEQPQHS